MEDKYTFAEEVKMLAKELIEMNHKHLVEAKIIYLFRSGKWEKGDKTILGKAKLASEDIRFIADFDFIIMINEDAWFKANSAQRLALLDHELSHCDYSEDAEGNRKWRVADHDVQELVGVVARHGLWEADLQKLMIAARNAPHCDGPHNQGDLFGVDSITISSTNESVTVSPEQFEMAVKLAEVREFVSARREND